jgi:adenosine kinase
MRLLLTGSIAIDRIMVFPGRFAELIQPDKVHALSISVLLDQLKDTRGGVAANIGYNLGLLGEHPILLGSVGDDEKAHGYMQALSELGVNIEHINYSHKPTATFTVMTDRDDCQVGGFYPGAMGDAATLSIEKFKDEDVFVVVSPHDPNQMRIQVEQCRALKKRLCYDVGQQISNLPAEDIRAGVEVAELVIVNDYELGLLEKKTDWKASELKAKIPVLVVTLGEQGCVIYAKDLDGGEVATPAVKVNKVADPTGAGDAFRAGFLYGYVRDWPLARCAQLGATTAAYAVETYGTQEHTFDLETVAARQKKAYS